MAALGGREYDIPDSLAQGLERGALGERVNCRLWGPGRYRNALSVAQERGAIRRSTRGRFVAEEGVVSR